VIVGVIVGTIVVIIVVIIVGTGSGLALGGPCRGCCQLVGLVLDGDSDLAELVTVLAGVVRAKEQLAASSELHAQIGLRTTAVTTVNSRERRARGNCSGHFGPHSFHGVLLNLARYSNPSRLRLT